MTRRKKDIYLGFGMALFFGIFLFVFIPVAIDIPDTHGIRSLSPGFWPKIIVGLVIVLGLLLGVQAVLARPGRDHAPSPGGGISEEPGAEENTGASLRVAGAMLGMLVYYFLVDPLGIVMASMLALFGFALLCGERRLEILIPTSILLPVVLYYFFVKVANKPMPTGFFF